MTMEKFGVQIALEGLAEARAQWLAAQQEFTKGVDKVMARLVHEAARNFMSAEEVARFSGLTAKRVRAFMRQAGLDPKEGKRVLSDRAAKALRENAALMGVKPHEMDLTSPLAYLPMGNDLRKRLQDQTVSQVKETWTWGGAEQLAQKLTDAGLSIEDARAWVAEVVSGNRS